MNLSNYKVVAGLAVSDMDRAVEFYEGKLGLTEWAGPSENRAYECAGESVLHVYLSPDHAGGTTATLAYRAFGRGTSFPQRRLREV